MYHNKDLIKQVLIISIGEMICVGLMLAVYALLDKFSVRVLIGGLFGGVMASLNFLFLTISLAKACDRAAQTGDSKKAAAAVSASPTIRLLILAAVYIVVLKAEVCDPVSAILPLLFVQLIINITEFFRKDGAGKNERT